MAKHNTTSETPDDAPLAQGREVVNITGNVGKVYEPRVTPNGTAVCNVRLAVRQADGATAWVTVAAWNNLADLVSAHVTEGDRLGVWGPVAEQRWTARDGSERIDTVVTAWVLHVHQRRRPGTGDERP